MIRTLTAQRQILALALLAFTLRAVVRFARGDDELWTQGYTFYLDLARSLADGHGYSLGDGAATAMRVPLYPLLLAAVTGGERAFAALVVVQSLIGAGTVWCGARLATRWFGATAGVCAAALLTIYPYYVIHDTALQETSLFTLLTALSVLALLTARERGSLLFGALGGLALALAVLTRSMLVPFALLAPLWLALSTKGRAARRITTAASCAAALALGLLPWLAYTRSVTGDAVLDTQSGMMFWRGNNPETFSRYPSESMDLSARVAFAALDPSARTELHAIGPDTLARDRWFLQRGLDYVVEHPGQALWGAAQKLAAAFGPLPSPRRGGLADLVHLLSYGPVLLLAAFGMWSARKREGGSERALVYALGLTFMAVTAAFFGHTSHRAFLDVYLVVFASLPLSALLPRLLSSR